MKKNGRNVVPPPPELLSLSPEVRNANATGNVARLMKTKPVLTSISPGYPWINSITTQSLHMPFCPPTFDKALFTPNASEGLP
jgi:hypothetical protein